MDQAKILRSLAAATDASWNAVLCGNPSGTQRALYEFHKNLVESALVMETSTIYRAERDIHRFGYLISAKMEPMCEDNEWEQILKDDPDYGPRPDEMKYRIRLLTDGTEYVWTNASFIRVVETIRR